MLIFNSTHFRANCNMQIICTRNEKAGEDVGKAIRTLLDGRFYVPVMRSVDNSMPPVIGEPFSETELPVVDSTDLLSPQMEIRAIAGPMNKEQAEVSKIFPMIGRLVLILNIITRIF